MISFSFSTGNKSLIKKCGTKKEPRFCATVKIKLIAMTSEESLDVVQKSDSKNAQACDNFAKDIPEKKEEEQKRKSNELMRLVYEVPEERSEIIENNNMLKENPPITIVEITEQNGCDTELGAECDNVYIKSPDLENKYSVTDKFEEFKEVVDRASPDECTDEELHELKMILESKPRVLERYLRECASVEEVSRIHSVTSFGPLSPRPHHEARSTSVTSDLFQLWLSSSPIKVSKYILPDIVHIALRLFCNRKIIKII